MPLTVVVPKTITIENNGLGGCLKILQVGVVFLVFYNIYLMKLYNGVRVPQTAANAWTEAGAYYGICLKKEAPSTCSPYEPCQDEFGLDEKGCKAAGMRWNDGNCLDQEGADLTEAACTGAGLRWQQAGTEADKQSDWCDRTKNKKFSYQYGSDKMYRYDNLVCAEIPEAEWSVKGETEMFYTTFFSEKLTETMPTNNTGNCATSCESFALWEDSPRCPERWRPTGRMTDSGQCICQCMRTRNAFVAGAEHLMLAFSHSADVLKDSETALTSDSTTDRGSVKEDGDERLVTTEIRDAETKQVYKRGRFKPGKTVRIRLQDLLAWAKPAYKLGDILEKDPVNGMSEGDPYPLLRMTGMLVKVVGVYYNKDNAGHDSDAKGPVCYIEISVMPDWSSKPKVDYLGFSPDGRASWRYRYNYGIRVKFSGYGAYSYLDYNALQVNIATSMVYLSIPLTVVALFAKYALGNLSKIYEAAINEKLNLVQMFNGLLARSVLAHHCFDAFRTKAAAAGKEAELDGGLRDSSFVEEVRGVFEGNESLDKKEIDILTKSCAGAMRGVERKKTAHGEILKSEFLDACSSNVPINLAQMGVFYDEHAKRGCLEKLFDPTSHSRTKISPMEMEGSAMLDA